MSKLEVKPQFSSKQESLDVRNCAHCGLVVPGALRNASYNKNESSEPETLFCCAGCAFVYDSLHSLGLQRFYGLREQYGDFDATPASQSDTRFEFLDDPKFLELHTQSTSNGFVRVQFYLEGVHCPACVWLVERLTHISQGVNQSRLNFMRKLVDIEFDPDRVSLSELARKLASLGYYPHPATEEHRNGLSRRNNRKLLLRLGVAAVAAANTMLFATSMYQGTFTGIEIRFERLFQWASLLLATPAVFYSATPFYHSALAGLRRGLVHIDLPLAIGILGGFSVSFVNTIIGNPEVYFDSICALIFLLLVGRYVQSLAIARIYNANSTHDGVLPHRAWRVTNDEPREVFAASLCVGDLIHVPCGERVPADGVLLSAEAYLDQAVLTGEARAVRKKSGEEIYAGTRNTTVDIRLRVFAIGEDTRIGTLIQPLQASNNEGIPLGAASSQNVDKVSRYFVICVCLLACFAFFLGYQVSFDEGVSRALALLVVSCPCALALAYPLSCSVAIAQAARAGVFIYNSVLLERILKCRTVFFDKTGTLTKGDMSLEYSWFSESRNDVRMYINELESASRHPIALSLQREFASNDSFEPLLADLQVHVGSGVSGYSRNKERWRIGSQTWAVEEGVVLHEAERALQQCREAALTTVLVCCETECVAVLGLGDSLKLGVREELDSLKKRGLDISLLSGDSPEVVNAVAGQLGIDENSSFGGCSPETKAERIEACRPGVMMIGDGVNDVAALSVADVALGIRGGAEACLKSADAYIADENISGVSALLNIAVGWSRTFRACMIFSLIYNASVSLAAVLGFVSPLVAAVLMPISSLTIVVIAQNARRY
jgi:Cu2+-exporting ATPase